MSSAKGQLAERIERQQVLPVLRAPTFRDATSIARALVEAGFPVIEFTMTADNALKAIAEARQVPGATVGCGTVTNPSQAKAARDAGASFIVAPTFLPQVAEATDLPTMLAGMTPSELFQAGQVTDWLVKLFPAGTVGPKYVRSVLAVFPSLRIVATGGVVPANARSFIEAGCLAVASGYPGPTGGHLDGSAAAAGARGLKTAMESHP